MKKKVLVAMSGGLESSVSAYLLQKQGYDVSGVTMRLAACEAAQKAIDDAKEVCAFLKTPHCVLDFSSEMQQFVINNFVSEYVNAKTPNPCVQCNKHLKFGKLLQYAKDQGYDFLATGHYAKIEKIDKGGVLCRPKDQKKDQTYFLYVIKKEMLENILFPLADYTKQEVRKIALDAKLPVAERPQSQDVCFVQDQDYKEFVEKRIGQMQEGNIVDLKGNILGIHKGIINYTLGQRRGLGIAAEMPLYVVRLDSKKNQVIVGNKEDLLDNMLIATDMNYLTKDFPSKIFAKTRYLQKQAPCGIEFLENNMCKVIFEQAQEAITPGQSVVFYDNDIVLGGGVITN